ncbi:MAG: DUF3194 domain-containing protein [Candidatus Freyarchaeum deiterrae]
MSDEKKVDPKDLPIEVLEELCVFAESEIRKYIYSKCPRKDITQLEIIVKIGVEKTTNLSIEVNLETASLSEEDNKTLAEEAVRITMNAVDEKLSGLSRWS